MPFKDKVLASYRRHEAYAPALFFVLGFLFDVVTLGRIDDLLTIAQQGMYLALIAAFISVEILEQERPLVFPRGRLGSAIEKLWEYRELVIHFFFGSLLSVYTLFYFKSASSWVSFAFLFALAALMVANESERFKRLGSIMRFALFSLCLVSYLGYVVPIAFGHIGAFPFLVSVALSCSVLMSLRVCVRKLLRDREPADASIESSTKGRGHRLGTLSFRAAIGVQALFLALYFTRVLPPVPLSIRSIGIYHNVEKLEEGGYRLSYERPPWLFWQHGAQSFIARPGDRIFVFARIFSPTRFKDQVFVRWLYRDPRAGWISSDAIPMQISGGRAEGFRGYAFKQNYSPGEWRVQVETTDGREIGRIGFTVLPREASELREFAVDFE